MMRRHDIVRGVITHSLAISACEKCQQCQQASYLSRAKQHHDFVPVLISHRAAISACRKGVCGASGT